MPPLVTSPPRDTTPFAGPAGAGLRGLRLLLVGPQAPGLLHPLVATGCVALAEADGLAAWSRVAGGWTFDALVTGLDLPGLGGVQLVRAFRVERPWLPVLLLAASVPHFLRAAGDGPMLALPPSAPGDDVAAALERLLRPEPGPHPG
jgi:CheY-like chemotaxis protein